MPRSSSRDLVDRFTGNRGYFHYPDSLRRWKNGVALAAMALVLGWLIVELAFPARAASAHTHGPLANPHAAFDANCQACHAPQSSGGFTGNPFSVFHAQDRWQSAKSLTCTKCHAGPAHHAKVSQKDSHIHNDCSNCHHDHNGRDFSLVHISDNHCTQCHKELPSHTEGSTTFSDRITGFAKDHPDFKPLADPDRRLKFSHALHMTPGLVYTADDQHPWSPAELGKQVNSNVAARFKADGNGRIQMECADCHQLDSGRATIRGENNGKFNLLASTIRGAARMSLLPARAEGAYYLPVNFDMHCKVCHPLRTPVVEKSGSGKINSFIVPHRRQPDILRAILHEGYAGRLAQPGNPALLAKPGPDGRFDPKTHPEIATFNEEIESLTRSTLGILLQNLHPVSVASNPKINGRLLQTGGFACGKCHYATEGSLKEPPEKRKILQQLDRSVWFEHAKFNHVSHRGLTCVSCHPGTRPDGPPGASPNEREPVLISSIKTCQACHAPAGMKVDLPESKGTGGGIRHSCTDCHRYHNSDRPLQGMGSPHRDPADPLSLSEFLDGGKKLP